MTNLNASDDPEVASANRGHILTVQQQQWLLPALLGGWCYCLVIAILVNRVLYGDGAQFVLFHLLNPKTLDNYDPSRLFASVITQTPIILGQLLRIRPVAAYAALYSVGFVLIPAGLFMVSLWWARKEPFLFLALGFAISVFGFGTNFINTEANIFYGLTWLSATILWLPGAMPIVRGIVLPLLALVAVKTYEGALFAGPLLGFWAFASLKRDAVALERSGLVIAGALFWVGAASALVSVLHPRDPTNAADFVASLAVYFRNPQFQLLLCVLCLVPVPFLRNTAVRGALILGGIWFATAFLARLWTLTNYYAYTLYYQNRAFVTLLVPVCLVLLMGAAAYRQRLPKLHQPAWVVLIPFLAAAAGDLLGSGRWWSYERAFCDVLDANRTPLQRIGDLKATGSVMGWSWTHPTLSVLLRKTGSEAVVANEPGTRWEPLDPSKPIVLPYTGICEAPGLLR